MRAIGIAILLFASLCSAQTLRLSGYYEHQLFPQVLRGKLVFQDYNKLRLDFAAKSSGRVAFYGDYVLRTFHGKTAFNALDFVPRRLLEALAQQLGIPVETLASRLEFHLENDNFLDNAYAVIELGGVSLRAGRQQLPWGSGYTWNPTGIFHDKDVLDPAYEKTGVNALRLEIALATESTLTLIAGPEDSWQRTSKGVKLRHYLLGFEVSLAYAEKMQPVPEVPLSALPDEKRRLVGADFSGEWLGLGVWGEGAYNWMSQSQHFGQYLLGTDYTFESGLYLIGEFYFNGLGRAKYRQYSLADWLRLLSARGENLGRHYLFFGSRYPIAELWNGSIFFIGNFNDRSGIVFPWLDFSLSDNAEVSLVGYLPFGRAGTEFGEFGSGGFARLRLYF